MSFVAREIERRKEGDDLIIKYTVEGLNAKISSVLIQQRARVDAGIPLESLSEDFPLSVPDRTKIESSDIDTTPRKGAILASRFLDKDEEEIEGPKKFKATYVIRVKDVV